MPDYYITNTWAGWNATTTSYGNTAGAVWWNWTGTSATMTTLELYIESVPIPQLTEEERQRQREAEERAATERRQRQEAERLEREAAVARAKELLLAHLNEEQKRELRTERRFTVISADGERVYRIKQGRAQNVELIAPDGRVLERYCAHPVEMVPDEDTMLAQKLMLEADEEAFICVANVTWLAA